MSLTNWDVTIHEYRPRAIKNSLLKVPHPRATFTFIKSTRKALAHSLSKTVPKSSQRFTNHTLIQRRRNFQYMAMSLGTISSRGKLLTERSRLALQPANNLRLGDRRQRRVIRPDHSLLKSNCSVVTLYYFHRYQVAPAIACILKCLFIPIKVFSLYILYFELVYPN